MARCLVVDLDRCTGCETCTVACKYQNNLGLGEYWNHVVPVGPIGKHPNIEMYWLPLMCQQCTDAPCIEICPTGASQRAENGVVIIDQKACIGCKSCLAACPYSDADGQAKPSVRWFNEETRTVGKCFLCNNLCKDSDGNDNVLDPFDPAHAVPPCVRACSNGARFYGDLDDPHSAASKALAAAAPEDVHYFKDAGNKPVSAYILSKKYATWQENYPIPFDQL